MTMARKELNDVVVQDTPINPDGICSICKNEYCDYGNNPYPIYPMQMRCCHNCNANVVVPARLQIKRLLNRFRNN